MAQQRSLPPRLAVPGPYSFQPQFSTSKTARTYPAFPHTPSQNLLLFSPSPTPTPSKRSRAPQGPLWLFTVLQLLSFYFLHQWLSGLSSPLPLAVFAFSSILVTAFCLNSIYRPWKGRHIVSSQWGLLFISGALLAFSNFLRFQGLQSAGPLETIFTDFAGFLATKVLLDSSNKSSETIRKARGLVALLLGVFLLSHGWARVSCSPLAIDVSYRTRIKLIDQPEDCLKIWSVLPPFLGGALLACQRMIGARTALKNLGKKRIQVLSYAMSSLALFPLASMQLTLRSSESPFQFGASFWTLAGVIAFGMVIAFFNEFYTEEKLFTPAYSLKAFQILSCCVCGLELLYGLDISLVGFVFCSLVLGIGVQELSPIQGQLSWDELGDSNGSVMFASWIRRPLHHIFSDTKSRKIAIFLLINTGFMVVEFVYGFLRNSLGLISDACHMLFDCAALAIGLYASYISRLPENSKFNYGYGRFEVVSGYANAVLLVLVASLIVLESIERILEPPEISTESLLVVSVGGLLVNIVGLIFFHEEHHHAHAHGGHGCSHSHSSHNSFHSSESTSNNSVVVLSNITSDGGCQLPSHNQYHSIAQNNGHVYSSSVNKQGFNSNYSTQLNHHDSQNLPHSHHQDHDHHIGPDHDLHTLHQHRSHHKQHALSVEHECGNDPNHSSPHHQPHDDADGTTAVHSHACSSGGTFHSSEGHDYASQQHNHGNGASLCDHSHGHNHKGIQHNDGNQHHDHSYGHHHFHHGDHNHSDGHCHNHQHHDQSHAHHNFPDDHHGHGHGHHHHMDHNMYGIFLHVLADTLGSVGVVTSTLLIKYKGWLITDPACSIFLSVLIIGSVVPLLRNSAEILLQRVPRHNERSLKEAIKRVGGLNAVQSLGRVHVWSLTNTEIVGSVHVQLAAGSDRQLVQEKSLRILREVGIQDLTLQIEEVS